MTVAEQPTWKAVNAEYLKAVASWIRARLELLALRIPMPISVVPDPVEESKSQDRGCLFGWLGRSAKVPEQAPAPFRIDSELNRDNTSTDWKTIESDKRAYLEQAAFATEPASVESLPALARLRVLFGLSPFEENVVRLCVAAELIHAVDSLCARAQDDPRRPYPTLNLALQLFGCVEDDYSALSPSRPLRNCPMIEVIQSSGTRLFDSALRIDERILEYCLGTPSIDDRLAALGAIIAPTDTSRFDALPTLHQQASEQIVRVWTNQCAAHSSLIHLLGPDSTSKLAVTVHSANQCGRIVYRLPIEHLPTTASEIDLLARIWLRERRLLPLVLFLDAGEETISVSVGETDSSATNRTQTSSVAATRFLNRVRSGIVIAAPESHLPPMRSMVSIEVARPTPQDQLSLWQNGLAFTDAQFSGHLASQFNLEDTAIRLIADEVKTQITDSDSDQTRFDQAWNLCRLRTRPRIDGLAQRIEPAKDEVELVLAVESRQQLVELEGQVRNRWKVYDSWGLRDRLSRGLGITAMFVGESGTGKTSAASEIARRLKLDLYRIDLSAVINKYVGETEKNLRRVFDGCEDCGAVLFFDECDAIFGKRTEIKDSHDRYANIEVSYLLQRIESYRGLAILATNKASAVDSAFLRRLRFVISFSLPTVEQRREIWRRLLPEQSKLPTEALHYDWLAAFDKLTGGAIHSAVVHAAFLAAQRGRNAITMEEVRDAIKAEYTKLNLPLRAAELQIPSRTLDREPAPGDDSAHPDVLPLPINRTNRILA